jgi:hypothetical protein
LAAWIAAMRAMPSTSPFFAEPLLIRAKVAGAMRIRPPARATRAVSALAPTSTMCAWPAASKWVSGAAAGTDLDLRGGFMKYAVTTRFWQAAIIAL